MVKKLSVIVAILVLALLCSGMCVATETHNALAESAVSENQILNQPNKEQEFTDNKNNKVTEVTNLYNKYKAYMTGSQKKDYKSYISNIKKAETKNTISKYKKKIDKIVSYAKEHKKYINLWTKRIDKYLKGSPTAGCGKFYAEAAWKYGIDPRWAVAISCVESGKGAAYIKGTYNVWGWGCGKIKLGNSWEKAIDNYIKQLRSGYGERLTYAAANKYCGSYWYGLVSKELSKVYRNSGKIVSHIKYY